MTELTPERLRERTTLLENPGIGFVRSCAVAWERDRREIERLRAERDTLKQNWQRCVEYAARVEEERDFLRKEFIREQAELRKIDKERVRLSEALHLAWRWIDEDPKDTDGTIRVDFMEDMDTIRRVLATTEKRDE